MNAHWHACDCNRPLSRREMLRTSGAGFASLALTGLLAEEAAAAGRADPLAPDCRTLLRAQAGDLSVHARRTLAGRHV